MTDTSLNPPALQSTIDMRRCKPGDWVRFANGVMGIYKGVEGPTDAPHPHRIVDEAGCTWNVKYDGTWGCCPESDKGWYVKEILSFAPTPNQSTIEETLKAEFLQHLYTQSGRTCGTFSGLWTQFKDECLREHLDALAEQLAQEKRRVWGEQRKGGDA